MATSERSPRVWTDVELGAAFGSPAASLEVFHAFGSVIGRPAEAWLFHRDPAPLLRGFYYPLVVRQRHAIPKDVGPHMVLIDDRGDQLWLSGASCGPGDGAAAAGAVLGELGILHSPLAGYDELHYLGGRPTGHRNIGERIPGAPPGKTFVRGGRLVNRMEFDKGGVTAGDLRDIWAMATEPGAWLGEPTALLLYDSRRRSEESGHDGCQLIATGETHRELWLQLPEPDDYDRIAPGRERNRYAGAYTEYQAAKRAIFRAVGIEIDPPDRPLRDKLIGRHRASPELIRWQHTGS